VTGDEDVILSFSELIDLVRAARVKAGDEDAILSFSDLVDQVRAARVKARRVAGRPDDFGDNPAARVWKELMRRDRKTGRFLYPTTFDLGHGTEEQRQGFAIKMLLDMARHPPPPVIKKEKLSTIRNDLLTAAAMLRKAAGHLRRLGLRPVHQLGSSPQIDPWIETAEEVEVNANVLDRMALVIGRDRGMLRERGLAVLLTRMTQVLFGRVLPSTIAKLVGAVTGQTMEEQKITDWVKADQKKREREGAEKACRSKRAAAKTPHKKRPPNRVKSVGKE
jgi:hypothetical protein